MDHHLRRRDLLRLLGGTLLGAGAIAQTRGEVRVLLAGETPQHIALVQALQERLPRIAVYRDAAAARAARPPPLAYIAVGPRALAEALNSNVDAPLVSLLVSRQAYAQLVERAQTPPPRLTAIYAEPSPVQQMRTVAGVMRRSVSVGTLISATSRYAEPLLRDAAARAGLSLVAMPFDAGISLSRNLLRLPTAETFLAFPDSDVYTPETLRELLESAYRRRLPVFGFSEALVNAGTLASAFASAGDLAAHLAELVSTLSEGRVPAPEYSRYWRVAINDNVARSLDIVIDDAVRSLGDRP